MNALILGLAILGSCVTGALVAMVHPLAGVLWLPAMLAMAYASTRPFVLLLCFVGVLFGRPAEFIPALGVLQLGKFSSLASLGLIAMVMLLRRRIWVRWSWNHALMGGFSAIVLASSLLGTDSGASVATYTDLFVKILIVYVLIVYLVDSPERFLWFLVTTTSVCCFIASYGLWSQVMGTATIEGSRAALVGYLGDPNDMAMTLLMAAPFAVQGVFMTRGRRRVVFFVVALVLVGGVLSTQSRGGLLGLAGAGYFIMRDRIQSRAVLAGLLVLALSAALVVSGVSGRSSMSNGHEPIDESAQGRLDAWAAGGRMVMAHPVLGVGFSRFADNYERFVHNPVIWGKHETHNMYIKCASETGLLGFGVFMFLLCRCLWIAWRARGSLPSRDASTYEVAARSQLPTMVAVGISAFFLSACWSWFIYILVAMATSLEFLETHRSSE